MYKDKDKQREATKERVRRYRSAKGVTNDVTPIEIVTPPVTSNVTPCPDCIAKDQIIEQLRDELSKSRLVTPNNVQAVARQIANSVQYQRPTHTIGCSCYACKPPVTHTKQAHTNNAND